MLTPRLNETTVLAILDEYERTGSVKAVCRKYGVSDTSFYRWKTMYENARKPGADQPMAQSEAQNQLDQCAREASVEVTRIRRLLGLES